ncbi:MAG: rod shape-determining protein MreD [Clostridia bacterium]|nr:rod shape-determining protein MreD [Clostridia bacterium]
MKHSSLENGRRALDWVQTRYLAWTAWGLLIALFALLQGMPHAFEIAGARPLFLVPLVVGIALFNGPIGGAAAGLAAGLLWDLYATHIYGFNGLLLMIIGCVAGLLIWLLIRNNWLTGSLLAAAAVFTQVLLEWLFCVAFAGADGAWRILWSCMLPNALYTALLSPLFYWLTKAVMRFLRQRF